MNIPESRRSGTRRLGQSTLEFVLTMILLMGFVVFYARLSFFLGYANLVQYATFMAARAYQAGAPSPEDQERAAQNVIIDLLKKSRGLPGEERFAIAKGVDGGYPIGAQIGPADRYSPRTDDYSWLQGVRYSFRGQLFVTLLGTKPSEASTGTGASSGSVTLTSESWLGREPTEQECLTELGQKRVEPDNGC